MITKDIFARLLGVVMIIVSIVVDPYVGEWSVSNFVGRLNVVVFIAGLWFLFTGWQKIPVPETYTYMRKRLEAMITRMCGKIQEK